MAIEPKKYETLYLVRPDISPEGLLTIQNRVEQSVAGNDGEMVKSEKWAERDLAYRINNYTRGTYYIAVYSAEPKAVTDIERYFNLSKNNVLRFITVQYIEEQKPAGAAGSTTPQTSQQEDQSAFQTPSIPEEGQPKVKSSRRQVKSSRRQVKSSRRQVKSSRRQVKSSRRQVKSSRRQVKSSRRQVKSSRRQVKSSRRQVKSSRRQVKSSRRQVKSSRRQVKSSRRQVKSSRRQVKSSRRQVKSSRRQVKSSRRQVKSSRRQVKSSRRQVKSSRRQVKSSRRQVKSKLREEANHEQKTNGRRRKKILLTQKETQRPRQRRQTDRLQRYGTSLSVHNRKKEDTAQEKHRTFQAGAEQSGNRNKKSPFHGAFAVYGNSQVIPEYRLTDTRR